MLQLKQCSLCLTINVLCLKLGALANNVDPGWTDTRLYNVYHDVSNLQGNP